MATEEKIWIESKDFEDRTEFRVKLKSKYPKGLLRKGMWERYMANWITTGYGGGMRDYVFVAYKKKLNIFGKLFGYNDYRNQSRIAVQKCDKLIIQHKKDNENPKIQVYGR